MSFFPRDEYFMRLALREAERALEHDDVPIGAVLVHEGEVLAAAPNERELRGDPTAHAEMLVLRAGSEKLGGWRLLDTVLYVTLEPCTMCAGAIVLARVPRVVYGAVDPKAGAAGSVLDVLGEHVEDAARRSGLRVHRAVHHPGYAREHQRPGAHRTGLQGDVDDRIRQSPVSDGLGGLPERQDLRMGGGIAAQLALVRRRADHLLIAGDHASHRHIVVVQRPLRLAQGEPHEVLVARKENGGHGRGFSSR
jgi:tRNA(adenine34) deaminase